MRKIKIFDTTLRDGEQAPGCTMNPREKLELARQLEQVTREQVAESAKRFQLDTIYFLKGKEV